MFGRDGGGCSERPSYEGGGGTPGSGLIPLCSRDHSLLPDLALYTLLLKMMNRVFDSLDITCFGYDEYDEHELICTKRTISAFTMAPILSDPFPDCSHLCVDTTLHLLTTHGVDPFHLIIEFPSRLRTWRPSQTRPTTPPQAKR